MSEPTQTLPESGSAPPSQESRGRIGSGFRIVSLLTLLSRILGMARDMVMAYAFGAGPLMDAFTLAFRIPNLARRLFGEGALTTAFLPVFVRELEVGGEEDARRVTTAVTITLGSLLLGIVLIGELVLGGLWLLAAPHSDSRTLIVLTAQMLPYLLLICLAAQVSAVLQSTDRFFWPALLPTILNAIWIVTVLVVIRVVEQPSVQIQVVALSVVASGFVQCGVAWWAMHAAGFHFSPHWRAALPRVREIAGIMVPILLGLTIQQVNQIADNLLAWGLARPSDAAAGTTMIGGIDWPLEAGTASALFFAQRMYYFPIGVIGIALGTVLFPLLSRHAERGELEQVGRDQTLGLNLSIAIGLPASVGMMLLAERMAVLFFQRGEFTAEAAALTADCILAYGSAVWASLAIIIVNRGFYALGDRQTPIRCALYAVGLNIVLNLILIWPLAGVGLAWASSIAAVLQLAIALAVYQRLFGLLDLADAARTSGRTLIPTLAMTAACWGAMQWLPLGSTNLSRLLSVMVPLLIAVAVFLATARLIGLREPFLLISRRLNGD